MRNSVLRFSVMVGLFALMFCGSTKSSTVFAQSANDPDDPADVLDAFIEALGGEMTLVGVETLSAKAKYSGWTEGTTTFSFKDGKRMGRSTYTGTNEYIEYHDGEKWIEKDPDSSAKEPVDKGSIQENDTMFDLPTDALRLRKQADLLEVVPKEEFEDSDYAHCVCLRLKDDKEMNIHRYFNADTGLMECVERWIDSAEVDGRKMRIRYYDFQYEESEGIMFLKKSRRTTGADSFLNVEYSDFEVDQPIDDSVFDIEFDDD